MYNKKINNLTEILSYLQRMATKRILQSYNIFQMFNYLSSNFIQLFKFKLFKKYNSWCKYESQL